MMTDHEIRPSLCSAKRHQAAVKLNTTPPKKYYEEAALTLSVEDLTQKFFSQAACGKSDMQNIMCKKLDSDVQLDGLRMGV